MAKRIFRFVLLDDHPVFLSLCEHQLENSRALEDIDYETSYCLVESDNLDSIVTKILDLNPDMLLTDYHLGCKLTGKQVADEVKKRKRIPVICSSNYSHQDLIRNGVIETYDKINDSMKGLTEGTFNGFFNKDPSGNQDLARLIRGYAFKPLDVSLESIGRFNSRLLEEFLTSPAIRTIKFHSSTKEMDDLFDWCEEKPEKSKLVWCEKLEDLLDTDILAIATVSLSAAEMQQIHYSDDRKEFFSYEYGRFLNAFKTIKEVNPQIPTMIYTNPVNYLLEFGRRLGLRTSKLFSPNEPDTSRFRRALNYILGEEKAEAFIRDSRLIVSGVHGDVKGVFPRTPNNPFEIFRSNVREAETIANEAGKKSQRAALKLGLPYFLPQKTNFPPFEDLAHYRQFSVSCHTHWDYELKGKKYKGFAAGPVKTSWKKGIRVIPDFEAVKMVGEDEFYSAISSMLETQRLYLNEQLGPELSVNA